MPLPPPPVAATAAASGRCPCRLQPLRPSTAASVDLRRRRLRPIPPSLPASASDAPSNAASVNRRRRRHRPLLPSPPAAAAAAPLIAVSGDRCRRHGLPLPPLRRRLLTPSTAVTVAVAVGRAVDCLLRRPLLSLLSFAPAVTAGAPLTAASVDRRRHCRRPHHRHRQPLPPPPPDTLCISTNIWMPCMDKSLASRLSYLRPRS